MRSEIRAMTGFFLSALTLISSWRAHDAVKVFHLEELRMTLTQPVLPLGG